MTAYLEARPRPKPLRAVALLAAAMAVAFAVAVWRGSMASQSLQLIDSPSTADEAPRAAVQQRSSQQEPARAEASSSSGGIDGSSSSGGTDRSSEGSPADPFAAPTRLHGPQRKAGPLDPREWLQPYALERHTEYMDYLEGWEQAHGQNPQPAGELPQQQPVTFPTCQVWVNHQYRILFLRHAKTGSTSVLNWFGCEQGGSCAPLRRLDPSISAAKAERIFSDYFVFTSVRNPYTRAVSQYKHMRRTMPARPECAQLTSWEKFCAFPPSMGLACRHHPQCCVMKEGYVYIHLVGQARCMTTAKGGLAVDYVIWADRLDEEIGGLFAAINQRRPPGVPELPVPRPEEVPKFNVAARCEEESRRQTESYSWGDQTYVTLAPAESERHCELREYFGPKHPQCLAQLNHFMQADLRLLMGGPILNSSGSSSAAVGSLAGSSSSGEEGMDRR
ncbi:Sulfotransferase family [Chlorella sorokiniana]|uniref:Sulfotransferase family n=1 Tax=Chlorella sorokiniana TaxID=3076 RepID=A0A2P6TQS9_CHLSO|nr:Sulfotransferase family [Chlorella sorokiniana]|eukprot:PRW56420.1 Sulfotransferase family [Chlorella sorokiniana]